MVNPPRLPLPDVAANPLTSRQASTAFLAQHWQRHPVLIRQALASDDIAALTSDTGGPAESRGISPATLWALAAQDDTEARLICHRAGRWRLQHGPFADAQQLPPTRRRWTLLVQNVDHHLDAASELLYRFGFLPQCRLDDLMVSLAGDAGGVGPHTDSYDVFLIQLQGQRLWTLGAPGEHELDTDQPLRIVRGFRPQSQVLLEAGDMLYVPPGWVHDGVACGPCMTASVGFRAPSHGELLAAWLQASADRVLDEASERPPAHYRDTASAQAAARWRREPGRLPADMQNTLTQWLDTWRARPADMREFVGCYLTEPKPGVWFDRPSGSAVRAFGKQASRRGVRLDRRTRASYAGRMLYINGEPWTSDRTLSATMRQLIDRRVLTAQALAAMPADEQACLAQWHEAGWLHTRR